MDDKITTLNDRESLPESKQSKIPLLSYIGNICLTLIVITLLIVVIYIQVKKDDDGKEDDEETKRKQNAGYIEPWNILYGIEKINISYAKNNKTIINSFKINGSNYNEEMGQINNGNDYIVDENANNNSYNLYIPYSALKQKNKTNGIILFIHGGSWVRGDKKDVEFLSTRYAKMGYITATMGYTLLPEQYNQTDQNIYRILDEITACIDNIIEQLQELEFDTEKLNLALGGVSAGAHIALLYGYFMKNSPLSIKFLINFVGPIGLEHKFWYKIAYENKTLESIEPEDINEAIKNGNISLMYNEPFVLYYMNLFLGNKYSDEDLGRMLINGTVINQSEPLYQEMYKIVHFSYPINYANKSNIPTLCVYGGNDSLVGVAMYKYLKEAKKGENIELIYMRYAEHELISYDTENGIQAMRDINYKILEYAKKYFDSDS